MNNSNETSSALLHHLKSRKAYAAFRLSSSSDKTELCFALSGLMFRDGPYVFRKIGELREVIHPPGEIELAAALRNKALLSAVARHMPAVTHELALQCSEPKFAQANLDIGWWIISALRCRTLTEILVPAVAGTSWDVIPAVQAESRRNQLEQRV